MGEKQDQLFQAIMAEGEQLRIVAPAPDQKINFKGGKDRRELSFNSSLKADFHGSRVTSDGGLILVRELDERLGLGDLIAQHLTDSRRGKNTPLALAGLLRQAVYSRQAMRMSTMLSDWRLTETALKGCARNQQELHIDLAKVRFVDSSVSARWCGSASWRGCAV